MGKNAPAFTVASFTMSMTSRPCTRPNPVTTPRRRRSTPLLVHAPRHVRTQLEETGSWINQQRNALAGSQTALLMLRLDGLLATAQVNDSFFRTDSCYQWATANWFRSKREESVLTLVSKGVPGCCRWSVIGSRSKPSTIKQESGPAQCEGEKALSWQRQRAPSRPQASLEQPAA